MKPNTFFYHTLAVFTVIVWGITLISTKILIKYGLSPAEIMLYRFVIAYGVLWLFYPHFPKQIRPREEVLFLAAGFFGGTVYFLTENTAVGITHTSNVALIVTTAPLLTALIANYTLKNEPLKRNTFTGSVIALAGVALIVFNGNFILELNPLGDLLSFFSALSWAFYSIFIKNTGNTYPVLLITRRVFFYSILTLLPWFLFEPLTFNTKVLFQPVVLLNLLFLGVIASSLCFFLWNTIIQHLGAVRTNNYIYFISIVTMFVSWWVLNEQITYYAIGGALLILFGVYFADRTKTGEK